MKLVTELSELRMLLAQQQKPQQHSFPSQVQQTADTNIRAPESNALINSQEPLTPQLQRDHTVTTQGRRTIVFDGTQFIRKPTSPSIQQNIRQLRAPQPRGLLVQERVKQFSPTRFNTTEHNKQYQPEQTMQKYGSAGSKGSKGSRSSTPIGEVHFGADGKAQWMFKSLVDRFKPINQLSLKDP